MVRKETIMARILTLLILVALTASAYAGERPEIIRLEIDWLVAEDHDHAPVVGCVIERLVASFRRQGIELQIELSDAIPETDETRVINMPRWRPFDRPGEWSDLEAQYRDHPPGTGWHYTIFAHSFSIDDYPPGTAGGMAELPGDEFIVSLGSFAGSVGTPLEQGVLLMHELGHNLSLQHTGGQPNSIGVFKPNYPSVMNYRYGLVGVAGGLRCQGLAPDADWFLDFDYSSGLLPDLDENQLSEVFGIGLGPVDWDCSGAITIDPVALNVSAYEDWCGHHLGALDVLEDYDDWSNLMDFTSTLSPDEPDIATCFTLEERSNFVGACEESDPCNLVNYCRGKDAPDSDVLYVNGSHGGVEQTVILGAGQKISVTLDKPPAGGSGKLLVHLNAGSVFDLDQRTELPFDLGLSCSDFLVSPFGNGAPLAVWNNIGKTNKVGPSSYFGVAQPDPKRAPTEFWRQSDPTNLPSGTKWTLQGIVINPAASTPKRVSATNAIQIQIE